MGSEQSSQKKTPAATPRDVEKALEKQRRMYEQKMKELIQETKLNTVQTSTTAGPAPQLATVNMERQHNAFNYNQNGQTSAPLYPSLYTGFTAQGNIATPTSSMPYNAMTNSNNFAHFQNNNCFDNTQLMPQPAARYEYPSQPSAPPSEAISTRPRSQSRHRDNSNDESCVTCGKMYEEKIYTCYHGHSSCHFCHMRKVPCGQCRVQITNRRNFDLEKKVLERRVQCPNSSDGCRLYIKMADMAIHEKECPFKVMECPSLGSSCTWSGKLSQLADHFDEMHPLHNQCDVDKEMLISNITNTSHTMHYIRIGTFNFLLHVKVSQPDSRIYMLVQLIGTKHSAAKWQYEIHMFKKNEPRRKFQYFDKCSSNIEPIEDIISSTTCAVIPQEYAKTFICNGTVAYKCYIKRDDDKLTDSVASDGNREKANGSRPRRNNFKKYVKKNRAVN